MDLIHLSDNLLLEVKWEPGLKPITTRVRLSLDQKVKLIEESMQPGFNQAKAAKDYGISPSTVNGILKNKFAIYCHPAVEQGTSSKKNLSRGKNDVLESKLYEWYIQRQTEGQPISGPMLKAKASELANSYDCSATPDFKFSSGWLERFKKRYDIRFKEKRPSNS